MKLLALLLCCVPMASASLFLSAYNIQVFGVSKIGKPDVVAALSQVIPRWDITLIQEIRDASETAIYQLLAEVNAKANNRYNMVISIRLGRTSSKEQYCFFYDKFKVSPGRIHQWPDAADKFERPPYTVEFNVISGSTLSKFAYLANHVKPTDAVSEIDAMWDVYQSVSAMWGLFDWFLGGDFNAACSYVGTNDWSSIRLRTDQAFFWAIHDNVDTTVAVSSCAYDRFVTTNGVTSRIVGGSAAAYYYTAASDSNIAANATLISQMSDHYPVEIRIN